ncbi:MAG: cation diffusion facilitator family transporter [Deltaproteobacteria bacterium]|nr:MAG: cation diffusion facilitator family transporter [Deltaproteobacteria bacterium]
MAGGSKAAVYAAIGGNTLVTIAKFAGFMMTGSGAMFSESVHSAADVANQAFLALGLKRADKEPDEVHPFGYGREAFVWSLISAVGLFFVGCGVTVMHGIHTLTDEHPHEVGGTEIALGILVFSLLVEGASWWIAVKALRDEAKKQELGFWENLATTDDPFAVAVFLEDSAAVLGVLFAMGSIGLVRLTHNPIWDAVGTLLIGFLLGFVAVFLIYKNRSLLIGKAMRPADRALIERVFEEDPAIESVAIQRAAVTGASAYRISAEIDFDGHYLAEQWLKTHDVTEVAKQLSDPEAVGPFLGDFAEHIVDHLGDEVDRIEAKLREALPGAQNIALEPD